MTAGAADTGLIDIARESMASYREDILKVMPETVCVLCLVFRVNQLALRSTEHSVADLEFKEAFLNANHTAREIAAKLRRKGIKAVNMPVGFPMEAKNWPGKMLLSNVKIFAIESGLGHMGWNRLVLHRELGVAVILGSVLTWTRFLAKEAGIFPALLTRKFKLKGSPKLMGAFAKCFPA